MHQNTARCARGLKNSIRAKQGDWNEAEKKAPSAKGSVQIGPSEERSGAQDGKGKGMRSCKGLGEAMIEVEP